MKAPCKKRAYKDFREAHLALERIKKRNDRVQVPQRSYKCEECEKIHLTKYPKEIYRSRESSPNDLMFMVKKRLKQLLISNSVEKITYKQLKNELE